MRWAIVAVVVVVAATVALIIRPPLTQPGLAHDLIGMRREIDFRAVTFPADASQRFSISDLPRAMRERYEDQVTQDKRHQDQLGLLLDRFGWPTEKMVGREAISAAMLVVQRAPDLEFKDRALSLMQRVGADDNANYAILVDQIAAWRQQPQTYGTQWTCAEDGGVKLTTPLKDPEHLAELRRKVGLPTYDKFARAFCGVPADDNGVRIIRR
jgi:hypothetical protein